jgi:hypothetical protein
VKRTILARFTLFFYAILIPNSRYEILQPIYDFLKAPDNTTLYELMIKCLNGFFKACRDDMEYQLSEEAFAESCEANNYEFLSDGTLFN